jgi:hypothetical protein
MKTPVQRIEELEYGLQQLHKQVNKLIEKDCNTTSVMRAWAYLRSTPGLALTTFDTMRIFDERVEKLIAAVREEERNRNWR